MPLLMYFVRFFKNTRISQTTGKRGTNIQGGKEKLLTVLMERLHGIKAPSAGLWDFLFVWVFFSS